MSKNAKKDEKDEPVALHAAHEDGIHHIVGIGNLRVLITEEEGSWFAQGVEIDYGAEGESVEDAKKNFEVGFEETIQLHLKMYGDIERFLVFPPSEVLRYASRNSLRRLYTHVSFHDLGANATSLLPFGGIDYLLAGASA